MWLNLQALETALTTASVGRRLVYLTGTSSTMDVARREAEEGAEAGTVVMAEEQTAGRGRFGRTWVSPAGKNLYFTLVTRPSLERLRSLSMIAPLATCLAIEDVTGLQPRIKWPNDVQLSGLKVSGMMIETELSGQDVRYSLVGIGVNVNFDIDPASEIGGIATSVKQELGRETPREELLAALLNHFESLYEQAAAGTAVHDAWRARLETLGRDITVTFRQQTYAGRAEDVDAEGNLVLLLADGSRMTVEAGEVSLRA